MTGQNNRFVDITGELSYIRSDGKVRFRVGNITVWLPINLVKINSNGTVTMPEEMARNRGFIR